MARVQGSLEYLIIIGVAIAVVAIVSLIVVNSFGSQQDRYVYNTCASAAASCKISLSANPESQCSFCDTSCSFTNGTSIFPSATTCCKQGKASLIYDGSNGCNPACSDGTAYDECSLLSPPKYCDSATGELEDRCGDPAVDPTKCSCPVGLLCNAATGACYEPSDCGDIAEGTCDLDGTGLYCIDGVLVKGCNTYDCPCTGRLFLRYCEDNAVCLADMALTCVSNTCDWVEESEVCTDCGQSMCCIGRSCRLQDYCYV